MRKILALLLCGSLVWAQSEEELDQLATAFEKLIKAGGLDAILDRMPEQMFMDMAEQPALLRRIAAAGAKAASKQAGDMPTTWERFVVLLEGACEAIPAGEADSTDAKGARAETGLCRARVGAVTGEPFHKEEWVAAAEFHLALHQDKPEGGKHLERAARILGEAARVGGEAATELDKRSNELCVKGAKQFPDNRYFAAAAHRAQLATIEATFEHSRSEAKKMLTTYLDSLENSRSEIDMTCYNDTVTFAREHKKIGVRAKYLSEEARIGLVKLDIPRSFRWKKSGRKLNQYDDEGELIRSFHFTEYKWTSNYYLGDKTYGGDNIKGLARIGEADVLTVVLDVKDRKKLRRARLNRAFPSAQMFMIAGFDNKGDYVCFRSYYFKAKKTRLRSVCVDIVEWEPHDGLDPEAEFVIDSMSG